MRAPLGLIAAPLLLVACGSREPPPLVAPAASAQPATEDPNRALTKSECESLSQWLVDVCQNRPNERSARVDGWCGDILRRAGDGTWAAQDCARHFRFMDRACMRSTQSVHDVMACDESVQR